MRRIALGVSVLVAACAGSGTPPPREPATAIVPATPARVDGEPENLVDDAPQTVSALPATPLTDLATACTELVRAVIDGRAPPESILPIEPIRDRSALVRADEGGSPASSELEFIGFAMELDIVLAGGPQQDESLRTIAFLTRAGLKLASVEPRGARQPQPAAPFLEGAAEFGRSVVDHARRGNLRELLVGEAERPIVANDVLFARILADLPKPETLSRVEALARQHRQVKGFHFDEMFVIGRDRQGSLWGFELELEESGGQLMFDSRPLVRVRRADASGAR